MALTKVFQRFKGERWNGLARKGELLVWGQRWLFIPCILNVTWYVITYLLFKTWLSAHMKGKLLVWGQRWLLILNAT